MILATYPDKVKGVRVELIKPDPPIHGYYKEVSVEVTRGFLMKDAYLSIGTNMGRDMRIFSMQ